LFELKVSENFWRTWFFNTAIWIWGKIIAPGEPPEGHPQLVSATMKKGLETPIYFLGKTHGFPQIALIESIH